MPSNVYFARATVPKGKGLYQFAGELFEAAGGGDIVAQGDLVAIKLSFSEVGNTSYLRPQYLRPIVEAAKRLGGKPFLTDCNTLYVGGRSNSVDHIQTAIHNGFDFAVVGAPVIIADGLKGKSFVTVEINQAQCKTAKIGADVRHADVFISAAHVHGHGGTGLAATFKNVGMGCGSRAGKQIMHCLEDPPRVKQAKCVGCGLCVEWCSAAAIRLEDGKAHVDAQRCIRCGECTVTCPQQAIAIRWGQGDAAFQKRIVEYTYAVLKDKKDKSLFFAFLIDVCPSCLCERRSDPPIIPDVGILASGDPVAVEQATFDLVNAQPGIADSKLGDSPPGEDKFAKIYPDMDSTVTMAYAEEIGLGSREYKLVEI